MDNKTFETYLTEAETSLKNEGNSFKELDIYRRALSMIKKKYDEIIEKEFIRQRKGLYKQLDDLFGNLQQVLDEKLKE